MRFVSALRAASAGGFVFALLFVSAGAEACPPNTVFSAFNGRGICARIGQGARAAAVCYVTHGGCPDGFDFEHKASDPDHDYCCPSEVASRAEISQCRSQCEPLMESVKPYEEAARVYQNCLTMCSNPNGAVRCPDGSLVDVGRACP